MSRFVCSVLVSLRKPSPKQDVAEIAPVKPLREYR